MGFTAQHIVLSFFLETEHRRLEMLAVWVEAQGRKIHVGGQLFAAPRMLEADSPPPPKAASQQGVANSSPSPTSEVSGPPSQT